MMNRNVKESEQALEAMRRAARTARERAAALNMMVPVWKDGRIVHVDPKESAQRPIEERA